MGSGASAIAIAEFFTALQACLSQRAEAPGNPGEQRLAEWFLTAIERILPEHRIIIRLLDDKPPGQTAVAVSAPVMTKHRDLTKLTVRLRPACLSELDISSEQLQLGYIRASTSDECIMGHDHDGIVIPVARRGVLVCVINVERPKAAAAGSGELEATRPVVVMFAEILTAAVVEQRYADHIERLTDRLNMILDQSSALVFVLDGQRRFLQCNRALTRLTRFPAGDLLATDLMRIVAPDDHARLLRDYADCVAGKKLSECDITLCSKRGELLRTIFTLEARFSDDGSVESVIGIGQDVTEVRDLQHQVMQAERLSHVGMMAAGVVHELNTPLTSISVYSEYLLKRWQEKSSGEDDLRRLTRIVDGAQRIHTLTRNLLKYAKGSGDQRTMVSLNDAVDRSLSFCEHVLREHDIELKKDLGGHLVAIYAGAETLQQLLINLITNACDAVSKGGVIHIQTRPSDEGHVMLEVADSGVGIDPESLPQIFDPFFSATPSSSCNAAVVSIFLSFSASDWPLTIVDRQQDPDPSPLASA